MLRTVAEFPLAIKRFAFFNLVVLAFTNSVSKTNVSCVRVYADQGSSETGRQGRNGRRQHGMLDQPAQE